METEPIRNGFGKALLELGKINENIISIEADLAKSTKSDMFAKEFPERTFCVGISEQDMVAMASGFASCGKTPFASTFAIFTERAFEQIRNSVARTNLNVKIVGSHAGIHTGEDGASAQSIEDLGIYRILPNLTVLCPADSVEAYKLTFAMAEEKGPMYMRTGRNKLPILFDENLETKIGKGIVMNEGDDVTIVACGSLVHEAMHAAGTLSKDGISAAVVNMSTIKPLDNDLIIEMAKKTGAIVTAEDHNIIGGLGSAVAETLSENYPVPLERVGLRDQFAESGSPADLYKKYGLTPEGIIKYVKKVIVKRG